ncbi:MAG: hypothetical protein F6K65_28100 [Moorea sp. SIO3C2]|nr:hypothetical protein [Moorena sp. SIO3C2]
MVEWASWWNGHLARFISRGTVPTLATDTISFLVVRYGADYPNFGYDTKNNRKSAPNTPYATCVEWASWWNGHFGGMSILLEWASW